MASRSRGSDLTDFPRPSVAVDVAVLTALPTGSLGVLLHRRSGDRAGQWALPGRFLRDRELLAHSVSVALAEKCGLSTRALARRSARQLHVFDDPERDDRGWVLSVAHLLALPHVDLVTALADRSDVVVAPVVGDRAVAPGRQRHLPYGQDEIVLRALTELRNAYWESPDPEGLLTDGTFTLSALHSLHLAVVDAEWQIDTFRRRMLPFLEDTGDVTAGGPGRPATLYRRVTR
jgi:8-oxo-dGTP diphosphatase